MRHIVVVHGLPAERQPPREQEHVGGHAVQVGPHIPEVDLRLALNGSRREIRDGSCLCGAGHTDPSASATALRPTLESKPTVGLTT